MANVKFLMGDLANLPNTKTEGQVYFTYKNVGSADNPNYVGALYLDKNNSVRIKMTANADIAEKDSAGNTITSTYIKNASNTATAAKNTLTFTRGDNKTFTVDISGATTSASGLVTTGAQTFAGDKTFNGTVNLKVGIYADTITGGALNLNNSDIYGINSLKFSDLADNATEGMQWFRDATHADSFWVNNGVMYFTPNRPYGGKATDYTVIHNGNFNNYAPTKTGTGATGTWGINISGNAATATKLQTARTITLGGYSSGSGTFDGSNNLTIDNYGYGCQKYVTENAVDKPYFRIAYTSSKTSYKDSSMIFVIDSGYRGGGFGIVKVCHRTDNITTVDHSSCEVLWLVRQGFAVDQLFVKGNAPKDGEQYVDLYFKATGTYNAVSVTVLSAGARGSKNRSWTFEEGNPRAAADIRAYSYTTNGVDAGNVNYASSSYSANRATNDNAGQAITSTYIKNIAVSGTTITVTRGDNKTFTLSTQDNNNKVTQSYVAAAEYTNWRTIPFGASNGGAEGFTPTTVTDSLYTTTTLSFQPSTGTVRATKFKGALVGNADTATSAGKATNDAKGQAITGYFRSASITANAGNNVITFTKGDNSTATVTIPGALIDKAGLVTTSAQTFSGAKTISAAGATSTKQSSQLIVSASDSSKASAIELYRSGNASWQIINDSGNLYIRNNYTSSTQSTYSQNGLTMSYNTGNAIFANNLKVSGKLGVSGENTGYNLYVNGSTLHNGVTYFANGTTYYINNSAYANLRAIGSSDNTYIAYPQGGGFRTTTNKTTGYLKITLPQSWTSTMMSFKVSIYEYQNNTSCEYYISGYNYNTTNPVWNACTAYSVGKNDTRSISNLSVRFGHDGSKCAIYIGAADTVWNYVQVQVHDIMVGYHNTEYSKWASGWNVGFTTTLATAISNTIETPNTSYSAGRLQTSAGDATHPVYFSSGMPVKCSGTLAYSISGNAATATKLQTARTISLTGSVTGSGTFNGSNNLSISTVVKDVNGSSNVTFAYSKAGLDYSAYTWLAAWNGTELRAVNKSQFATAGHTHNYAGSSNAGGSANSAVKLDTTTAGSATQPVYFSGGKPVACTYTLGKSVPSNAVFTDTNTWRPLGTGANDACAGNDSRLSNARPASDVYAWAKASTKPSYSWGEITGKPTTFTPSNHEHTYLVENSSPTEVPPRPSDGKVAFYYNVNMGLENNMPCSNNANAILSLSRHAGDYSSQLGFSSDGNVYYRAGDKQTSWKTIFDSSNYTSYTVTKTGSGASGTWGISVSGNAATATKLATARTINGTNFDGTGNITTANWGTARTITIGNIGKTVNGSGNVSWSLSEIGAASASHTHSYLPLSGGTMTGVINSSVTTGSYLAGNKGTAIINSTAANGYNMLARMKSTNGVWTLGNYGSGFHLYYTTDSTIAAGTNGCTKDLVLLDESGNTTFPGKVLIKNSGLELYATTPCIDFHVNDFTNDYSSRIIAYNDRIEFVFA